MAIDQRNQLHQQCPLHFKKNRLLAQLSAGECERICPALKVEPLVAGEVLSQPGVSSGYVYFPLDCVVALCSYPEDGSANSIGVIGNEGMIGIEHFLGGNSLPYVATTLHTGRAVRIEVDMVKREFQRGDNFHRRLLLYSQSLLTDMAQTSFCNVKHSATQRLARLLLQIMDRVLSEHMSLTHECIAQVLGVRREVITQTTLRLRKGGAIDYGRGNLSVLDRASLETQSCSCYAFIKDERDRLIGKQLPFDDLSAACHRVAPAQ